MNVNHLHLMVPDVPAASAFFEKYFELRKANGNAGLTVLLDDNGFVRIVGRRLLNDLGDPGLFVVVSRHEVPRSCSVPTARPRQATFSFVMG